MSTQDDLEDLEELRMDEESFGVAKRIVTQGVRLVPRPIGAEVPQLPRDVTSLHDEALMELWGKFTSWTDYLAVQHAAAEIDRRAAERALDAHGAMALLGTPEEGTKKESVTAAKARRAADPRTVELTEKFDDAHAYAKLLGVMVNNLDRDAQFLSRELTRRTGGPNNAARAGRRV